MIFRWQPYKHGWLIYLMLSCLFASMKTDVGCLKNTGASLETCMLHFLELTHEVFSYILKFIGLLWHTGEKKSVFFCTWQLNDPVSRQLGCGRIWLYSTKKNKKKNFNVKTSHECFSLQTNQKVSPQGEALQRCFLGSGGVKSENLINCLIPSALCGPVKNWIVLPHWEILSFTPASPAVVDQSWSMGSD